MTTYDNFNNIQNLFTPDIIQKISEAIGQSAEKTKAGLKSAIPAFLSGVLDKGSTKEGADTLVDMVNTHSFETNILPDASKLSETNDVVNNIFGNNLNNTISKLTTSTGLNASSVTKMMGMVAPIIMGIIGTKVKNEKLNSSGLMNFFNQQKKSISDINIGEETAVSEFYNLGGEHSIKDSTDALFKRAIPWKIIIFTVGFLLFVMWFWWNIVQIESPTIR